MREQPASQDINVGVAFMAMIDLLKANRPRDHSDRDRGYAIAITEMEKVFAYFAVFAMQTDDLVALLSQEP